MSGTHMFSLHIPVFKPSLFDKPALDKFWSAKGSPGQAKVSQGAKYEVTSKSVQAGPVVNMNARVLYAPLWTLEQICSAVECEQIFRW